LFAWVALACICDVHMSAPFV